MVLACSVALAACATLQAGDPAIDRAKSLWTNCGSRNASALARTRLAVNLAAYASVDACTYERRLYHDAMRKAWGPGHDVQIRDAAERFRSENARALLNWLTQERDRMRREDLMTGRDPAARGSRTGIVLR